MQIYSLLMIKWRENDKLKVGNNKQKIPQHMDPNFLSPPPPTKNKIFYYKSFFLIEFYTRKYLWKISVHQTAQAA